MSPFKIVVSPFCIYNMSPFSHRSSNGLAISISLSHDFVVFETFKLVMLSLWPLVSGEIVEFVPIAIGSKGNMVKCFQN
jgi:hypothetical protein